jgi:SAM-dependent methyltransferase
VQVADASPAPSPDPAGHRVKDGETGGERSLAERPVRPAITDDIAARSKYNDLGRWHINRFVDKAARSVPAGSAVLDAGAGEGVYRRRFAHCCYQTLDLAVGDPDWDYSGVDYVAPLHRIPVSDDRFDAVLCTQVLEHVELPRESVAEMYRVLKPGGRLYVTVPMSQGEHQAPHDYFRYTSNGIRALCAAAGFRNVVIEPFGGMWTRWAYELPAALNSIPVTGLRTGRPTAVGIAASPLRIAARSLVRLLQHLCLSMDRFDQRRDHPLGWSCVATK